MEEDEEDNGEEDNNDSENTSNVNDSVDSNKEIPLCWASPEYA